MMTMPSIPEGRILDHLDDGVLTLTLNAPERLNALDEQMLERLTELVMIPSQHRVLVLRGAGRAFCSGIDLGTGIDLSVESPGATSIDAANALVAALASSPVPVVSVIQGPCAGVGVPIALAADVVIASTEAYFQLAFTRIGLMPDGGATSLVAASVGRATAMRMALLADRISATDAYQAGLIGRVTEPDALDGEVTAVTTSLRNGPSDAFALTKSAINTATLGTLGAAFVRERAGQLSLLRAPDFVEGVEAFLSRRPPVFENQPRLASS